MAAAAGAGALPPLADREVALGGETLRLRHIADPAGGVYSQGKKQCDLWEYVWGSTFVLAELVARLALDGRARGGDAPPDASTDDDEASADAAAAAAAAAAVASSAASSSRRLCGLELGAGSGVASIVAARSGGARMLATDVVLDALRVSAQSAALNGVRVRGLADATGATVEVEEAEEPRHQKKDSTAAGAAEGGSVGYQVLDWHQSAAQDAESPLAGGACLFDLVLGADVLFFNRAARPVAATAAARLAPGGVLVLVDPGRCNVEAFIDALDEGGVVATHTVLSNVRTPACNMRKCEIVVAQRVEDVVFDPETGVQRAPAAGSLRAQVDAAVQHVARTMRAEQDADPASFGYVLKQENEGAESKA